MSILPQVVDELRLLFKKGATTSRLIQHIARRHECQENCSRLAREYFWKAFEVLMLRVPDDWSVFFADDLQHSALNETVLHEILVHQTAWKNASESSFFPHGMRQ